MLDQLDNHWSSLINWEGKILGQSQRSTAGISGEQSFLKDVAIVLIMLATISNVQVSIQKTNLKKMKNETTQTEMQPLSSISLRAKSGGSEVEEIRNHPPKFSEYSSARNKTD